jgi:hypothetical protein
MEHAEPESIRLAMDQAWRDHHHVRDQTWRALPVELVLAAGMVVIGVQFDSPTPTVAAGALLVLCAMCSVGMTLQHRKVEIRKFTHIMNCEEALGLHTPGLIANVKLPGPFTVSDALKVWKTNTLLFILRMHIAIALFGVIYVIAKLWYSL